MAKKQPDKDLNAPTSDTHRMKDPAAGVYDYMQGLVKTKARGAVKAAGSNQGVSDTNE